MANWLNLSTIKGNLVSLVPLEPSHKDALLKAAADGNLWELWFTSVPSKDSIDQYLDLAFDQKEKGTGFPFVVVRNSTGEIIGSTRYCNASSANRRLEIGYTWYGASHQRTGVNSDCKLLLLSYAFEKLNCIAVEFRTDWFNLKSRAAIARLGAKQDGILRNQQINVDGSYRDTVVFSITEVEWPGVKKSLLLGIKRNQNSQLL